MKNILVCEDDFATRSILTRMLVGYGEIDTAVNGREAVEAHRAAVEQGQPYDLIFLDVMMPELDGQNALKAIRKAEDELPEAGHCKILMTTAMNDLTFVSAAFRADCDAYLVKPVRRDALTEELGKLGMAPLDAP